MFPLPSLPGSFKHNAITHLYAKQICRTSLLTWISHIKGLFQELFFSPVKGLLDSGDLWRPLRAKGNKYFQHERGCKISLGSQTYLSQHYSNKISVVSLPLSCQRSLPYYEKARSGGQERKREGWENPILPLMSCTVSVSPQDLLHLGFQNRKYCQHTAPWPCCDTKAEFRQNPVAVFGGGGPTLLW